jgi:hypothetical protein
MDVFEPGLGAVEDSLVGAGFSLIVSNNYGYTYNQDLIDTSTEPGIARIDIDPFGKGCHKVWTNTQVNPGSYGAKLSTRTGLAYVISRKLDPSSTPPGYPEGMNVWYFSAIDFRTGKTVWEKLVGTGRWFDGYWPLPFIGPNGALYAAGNGGIFAVRDTTGADVVPIPAGPATSLPDYAGAPTWPHPTGNSRVPQNRLLAPNGFNSCHLDPWMSDTADLAGPLGFKPAVVTSTFATARPDPIDANDAPAWLFLCITPMFDSHGRLLTTCFAPHEATVVLADPDTLEVLSAYPLGLPSGDVYRATGRQAVMRSVGSSYAYLDARDRLTSVSGGKQIVTLVEGGSAESPVLALSRTYDLTSIIPAENNDLSGVMLDWQGRIWFITIGTPTSPAVVGVLDPAKYTDANPNAKVYTLPPGEFIRNTFAVTKSWADRASAYIVTSQNMYRIDAGSDNQPKLAWSAPYDTIGTTKDGQYELGSGTSPTVLGDGKYVAITDNAIPMKVVVYRTNERLKPNEDRVVCQVEVFADTPGALSNSLIGFRDSLIASNNYNYLWDWPTATTVYPSEPGFARIDINPSGKGCKTVWTNTEVATTTSPRLSTKTGLIYTVSREYDAEKDVFVYYWIALDFHTGKVAWKKMAGTGNQFDSFYPALAIGPNHALYVGVFGGFMTVRDTR